MKKIWLAVILAAILTAVPANASLREALEKLRAENQHRQSLVVSEHTEELKEQDEYPYQEQDAETFDETVQEGGQIDDTLEQRQANTATVANNIPSVGGGYREAEKRADEYLQHRRFLIAQSERSAGVSPDETDNPFIRESVDRMFREQTEEERMAEQRRRERKEITGGLIVITLSAVYLFWIRRILKSKTAKSVPWEIFRDAATVAGLLLALALLSEMVYGSSGFRAAHFRSAMFIAVSSAVLPYLCMMYLADGYRHPYPWRAKILYPQTAAMLAYWLMLYAADIADGEGSGNVMASLFGLFLSSVFCVALKIKLGRSQSQ